MMATSVRPPDRQLRHLYVLLIVEFASLIGLSGTGLLVVTDVPHNARPLLSTTWCLLTAAVIGALVAIEWQLPADAQGLQPAHLLRRAVFTILGAGSLALLATLLTMLSSQPDPSLYRVTSAAAAARAAIASLPRGIHAQITAIESVPSILGNTSERAWHIELETADTKPRRIFDVTIDAKSGETYRDP